MSNQTHGRQHGHQAVESGGTSSELGQHYVQPARPSKLETCQKNAPKRTSPHAPRSIKKNPHKKNQKMEKKVKTFPPLSKQATTHSTFQKKKYQKNYKN